MAYAATGHSLVLHAATLLVQIDVASCIRISRKSRGRPVPGSTCGAPVPLAPTVVMARNGKLNCQAR